MSRRSPGNERYQKYTGPKGQTRKSAAAAKPSRKEGSGTSSSAKSKSKAGASKRPVEAVPAYAEYPFWRRAWWISLVAALVALAISFYLQYFLKDAAWARPAGVITLAVSYAAIIAGFLIDYRILRRMRDGSYVSRAKATPPAEKPAADDETPSDSGDDTP